ncbi:Subtilisin BL [compost metagenome]
MRIYILAASALLSLQARAADPFAFYQWGMWNQGQPQVIDLDPLKTYKIPARVKEDIHLPAPLKAPKKIIVAVLDTGVQKDHPDLKNIIHRKESECKALAKFEACIQKGLEDGEDSKKTRQQCEKKWMDLSNPEVDQDKNGYPLDCQGWSLLGGTNAAGIMGRPDFTDTQGHGTHVAGIIAAEGDNGIGIRGVSNNVEILPVQVLGQQPSEPVKPLSIYDSPKEEGRENLNRSLGDLVARGVIYAMNSGAQVINFSMGWPQATDSQFMRDVIKEAQKRGVIIVAAAGNDSTRALLRPCGYENVICVGATGPDGAAAHFSNFGSGVDIMAPGVNILSTYPDSKRPVRFRSTWGYEFLSGTSQATPFVAGAIGEMLARGIPASEIYPRLLVGTRKLQDKMALISGPPHEGGVVLSPEKFVYEKYSAAGNMDLIASLKAIPEPVIVPTQKEKIEIPWDRRSSSLKMEVSLVNKWASVNSAKVRLTPNFAKPHPEAIRPELSKVTPSAPYKATWDKNEVRKYFVQFEINDAADPANSRIPSELDLTLDVAIDGVSARRFVVESEITVELGPTTQGSDIEVLPLRGMPKARTTFWPIYDSFDGRVSKKDYFTVAQTGSTWQLWLVSQDSQGAYNVTGGVKIRHEGNADNVREQILTRIDLENDGDVEYVVGLYEDNSESEEEKPSTMTFYVFSEDMKLIETIKYGAEQALAPYRVYWQMINGRKSPAWVGGGKDPDRKRGIRDRWENPTNYENQKLRFYFLNEKNQLKAVEKYKDYNIIDIIEPRQEQILAGRVPVLLAKNLGTEAKPSYLYSFAVAEMVEGKIENFMELDLFGDRATYRNMLDTRVDSVGSLDKTDNEFYGTFWFGEGTHRQQRVTLFDTKNYDLTDQQLSAERSQFDSALWVRAVFAGAKRQGAFVLTNSEIQYHDLVTGKVVTKSYERYTFYPGQMMDNLYNPLTLVDSRDASVRLPAIYTTETSGLSRGVKMLVPVFAKDGSPVELVSPARLRFKSAVGCSPMDAPVFSGKQEAYKFDYYCGDKILRVNLKY